jgi:hypothetical protein
MRWATAKQRKLSTTHLYYHDWSYHHCNDHDWSYDHDYYRD